MWNFLFLLVLLISATIFLYMICISMEKVADAIMWIVKLLKKVKRLVKRNITIEEKANYHISLWERIWTLISNSLKSHILVSLFYSFIITTFALLIVNEKLFDSLFNVFFKTVNIFAFIYLLIKFLSRLSSESVKNVSHSEFAYNAIFVIIMFIFIAISIIASLLTNIKPNVETSFMVVFIILILMLTPLCSFAAACLKNGVSRINIVITFIVFVIFECSLYLLFGVYNVSTDNELWTYVNQNNIILMFTRLFQSGTKYIFNFPGSTCRIEYFFQYIIGFFINALLLGFFVSYISSKVVQCKDCIFDKDKNLSPKS